MTTRSTRVSMRVTIWSGAALLAGCTSLFGPGLPDAAVPLTVLPPEYTVWWGLVEECSGLQADLEAVEWWYVPASPTLHPDQDAVGQYFPEGNRIALAGQVTTDGFVVRHEMLHAVLEQAGLTGHPPDYFESRCGGLVSCGGSCQETVRAQRPITTGVPQLREAEARVSVRVVPERMSRTPGVSGCSTIIVQVENRGGDPALLQADADDFEWSLVGWGAGSGGGPVPPNPRLVLGHGEVRRYAYDCPGPLATIAEGEYEIRGRWQGVYGDPVTVEVVP